MSQGRSVGGMGGGEIVLESGQKFLCPQYNGDLIKWIEKTLDEKVKDPKFDLSFSIVIDNHVQSRLGQGCLEIRYCVIKT